MSAPYNLTVYLSIPIFLPDSWWMLALILACVLMTSCQLVPRTIMGQVSKSELFFVKQSLILRPGIPPRHIRKGGLLHGSLRLSTFPRISFTNSEVWTPRFTSDSCAVAVCTRLFTYCTIFSSSHSLVHPPAHPNDNTHPTPHSRSLLRQLYLSSLYDPCIYIVTSRHIRRNGSSLDTHRPPLLDYHHLDMYPRLGLSRRLHIPP